MTNEGRLTIPGISNNKAGAYLFTTQLSQGYNRSPSNAVRVSH